MIAPTTRQTEQTRRSLHTGLQHRTTAGSGTFFQSHLVALMAAVALTWLFWASLAMAFDFSVDPQGSPIGGRPADIHTADGSALKITAADLGLPASVNIDGFSYGRDTVEPIGFYNYVVLAYSVDRQTLGNGGVISTEVRLNGAAGDKFNVRYVGYRGQFFPILGPRRLSDAPIHNLSPLPLQSDLDGLSKEGPSNRPIFFTVDGAGVPGQSWGPADILVKWTSQPPSVDPVQLFASAADLNLLPGDDIDGLALGARVGFDPPTAFNTDVIVWVSLSENSPTRAVFGGELVLQVYPSVAVAVDAPTLGILPSDELNALTAYDPGTHCLSASAPSPADREEGVPPGCNTVLSWTQTVVSPDICVMLYVGTNRDEVENGTSDCYVLTGSEANPSFVLPFCTEPDTTYYWRLDVYNCRSYEPQRCPSEVWSFTTGRGESWSMILDSIGISPQNPVQLDIGGSKEHSDKQKSAEVQPDVDFSEYAMFLADRTSESLATDLKAQANANAASVEGLDALFPCGDGPVGYTVCASSSPFPSGRYVLLVTKFVGDIPLQHNSHMYQYGAVFDSDGQAGNNYVPHPSFPNDFFAYTDKWYELTYSPGNGWQLKVTDARLDYAVVSSSARVVIAGSEMGWFIPRGELDSDNAGWRITAFAHTGDYGLSGGFWSADYHPPVGNPLVPIPAPESVIVIGE